MDGVTVPFEIHAEVWVLIAGVIAVGWFAARVVQPKAVSLGYEPITRAQKTWFVLAVAAMWVVSDWPVHEIAEERLYFVHMGQHLFLSMLIPAMFVLAIPRWLFELVLSPGGRAWNLLRTGSKPIVAGITFNALTMLLHWSRLVQLSFESGALHFLLHLMVFTSGLLMWMPVLGPVREWRLSPLGQCIYLFCMSIVPTVPGGWLVFAEDVVYRHYDTPERLWGIDVLADQQAAGVVMKLAGGFFLWAVIFIIFTRWATSEMKKDEEDRTHRQMEAAKARRRVEEARRAAGVEKADDDGPLTFDEVSERFARTPAPAEPER